MATLHISDKVFKKGVVVLALDEYKKLQSRAVPTHYLTGKKALALDRLVEEGLKDYREGRAIKASSLKEAFRKYDGK